MRESSSLFPFQTANRHAVRSGESHDAWAGQLFPASRTPHQRRLPRPVASPVQTAALIRQQQQQCCCYLIYKLPVLWRSGAAARLSRLHTPVETGTPPRRRGKLRSLRFHERPSAIHENCVSLHCPPLPTANTALVYGWSTGGKPFADLSAGLTVKNHNTLPPGNVLRFRDIFILSGFCQFNHQLYRGDLGQHAVELIE